MFHGTILNSSKLFVTVVVLTTLFACQALAEAPWAMFGANSARTNQSSWSGPGEEMRLLWRVPTEHRGGLYATVAEDGTVFALDHNLYGYDRDGRLSFQEDIGPAYWYGTEVGLIGGDRVYAGLVNTLYTFGVSGGKIGEYTIPDLFDNFYFMTPAIGPAGEIILPMRKGDSSIGAPGAIASISADGGLNWMFELGGLNLPFPPSLTDDGRVMLCIGDLNDLWGGPTSLVCLDPNGMLRWRQDNIAFGFPLVDNADGRVLVRANVYFKSPSVLAFDLDTGDFDWEFVPGFSCDEPAYDGKGLPLALDSSSGVCCAFWYSWSWEYDQSQVLTAIGPDGELAWSVAWQDNRERSYYLPSHPIVDADGLVYVFYSWQQHEQGVDTGGVGCSEVFDPQGLMIAHNEYPSTSLFWTCCEPAIGPDNRIYMFAGDFDYPVTSCLYAFGTGSEPAPEYRPTILTAGYGLSNVTDEGGTLNINASVSHPLGASNISSVDVLINGQPTGLSLLPGASRGEYSLSVQIAPGMLSPGQFLLELVATDTEGHTSDVWPYFTVGRSSAAPGK
jgi:hypothetical protein